MLNVQAITRQPSNSLLNFMLVCVCVFVTQLYKSTLSPYFVNKMFNLVAKKFMAIYVLEFEYLRNIENHC